MNFYQTAEKGDQEIQETGHFKVYRTSPTSPHNLNRQEDEPKYFQNRPKGLHIGTQPSAPMQVRQNSYRHDEMQKNE